MERGGELGPIALMSPIILEVRLPDDQLVKLAELIAERIGGSRKPLTAGEAAKALGWCADTVRNYANAGLIKTLPRPTTNSRILIPPSEIDRLLNPEPQA